MSELTQLKIQIFEEYQKGMIFHPFTCMGSGGKECHRNQGISEGLLEISQTGLSCPCGLYGQETPDDSWFDLMEERLAQHPFLGEIKVSWRTENE